MPKDKVEEIEGMRIVYKIASEVVYFAEGCFCFIFFCDHYKTAYCRIHLHTNQLDPRNEDKIGSPKFRENDWL